MSNYDQTRQTIEPNNIVLNAGIVAGWASLIKSRQTLFGPEDIMAQPYLARGAALIRDIIQGTPDANASVYSCNIADLQLADKLALYVPHVMRNHEARDRGVPHALQQVIDRLRVEIVA